MKKIEFDEATIEAAYMGWIDTQEFTPKFYARFYADAANRQLEAMEKRSAEKPAFAGPKRQNHQAEIAGHLENGFRARGSYGGNFWHDVAEHAAMIVTSRFVVEPKSEGFNNSGAIEESGQVGVSPPLVEGERPALTDMELCKAASKIFEGVDMDGWAGRARRLRELLAPQFAEQVADLAKRFGDDAAHHKERARKAEQSLNSLRREGEHHMRSVDESDDPYDKGLRQGMLIALYAAGFTIIPAQPLKVIRND